MDFKAILFDTRSIQQYIFSGNQLKTNIGASYLVETLFSDALIRAVEKVCGAGSIDQETWHQVVEPDWEAMDTPCRVGYIGGGNALLLFRPETETQKLREVVSTFTKLALVEYPGLKTGAAIGTVSMDKDGKFLLNADGKSGLDLLHEELKNAQNTVFPEVSLPYTGLTLSCSSNGETANVYDEEDEHFYSWEIETKILADRKTGEGEAPAERELMDKLRSVIAEEDREDYLRGWAFPTKFDELGQKEKEDYLAVVHIDGNNMGKQFRECHTLTKRKNLSISIRKKTICAFNALVDDILSCYGDWDFLKRVERPDGEILLPIRPLILGGDDMTFVCHARLALQFAAFVMSELKENGICSCGGIAILPTSYPFFRGYEMTEQLCGEAKKRMRQDDAPSCWLDFAILHGEQASQLSQIRAQEYHDVLGRNMHFGPYRVDASGDMPEALDNLLLAMQEVHFGPHKMPMSKLKEMRRVLAAGRHEQIQFKQQLDYLIRTNPHSMMRLPAVEAWKPYEKELWAEDRTPYVDMIEMLDFCAFGEVENSGREG
ncbi:hypothetical protein [Selenomonas sp. KH1T6]|uniref:hypothetical protein n=1 Tax=Selenomonas sp. KH1T6 TaxID=3158784 RepID=UPI0008A7AE8A|nr:hypothetical protein SAMN05216583_102229 [Selenomonas ruminantium]